MGKDRLEYENEVNEIIDFILETNGTSRKELDEKIKIGVSNGYSARTQVNLLKHILS